MLISRSARNRCGRVTVDILWSEAVDRAGDAKRCQDAPVSLKLATAIDHDAPLAFATLTRFAREMLPHSPVETHLMPSQAPPTRARELRRSASRDGRCFARLGSLQWLAERRRRALSTTNHPEAI
jgi:hypothetical protein